MTKDKAASNNGTHQSNDTLDISAASQRVQILEYLEKYGSATTLQIRDELHILSPAPRILELRAQGHNIETYRVNEKTPDNKAHSVAKYVLLSDINIDDKT
ncbi:helix-turn-helix domain-containing protein [Colwellia sp. RE-S-Sl-9]